MNTVRLLDWTKQESEILKYISIIAVILTLEYCIEIITSVVYSDTAAVMLLIWKYRTLSPNDFGEVTSLVGCLPSKLEIGTGPYGPCGTEGRLCTFTFYLISMVHCTLQFNSCE